MLQRIRDRISSEEKGFTLIELLVVVLIIGILAAIAIPAFLGQREKAQDSSAKSASRNAASAAEAFATDNSGSYMKGTTAMAIGDLTDIEPTLTDTSGVKSAPSVSGVTATGYTVSTESKSGDFFNLTKASNQTYRCKAAAAATACSASSADKW